MVSELKPRGALIRYTTELHQWLPSYLEVTENAGQSRFKRLLEFFDLNSSGSRVVLDAVKQFANADKDDCADSFVDVTESNRVSGLSAVDARWEAVKNALYESLRSENKLAPETQLMSMNRNKTENLLEFVMRYNRLAEEFLKATKVSEDRALQILYRKLPQELQRLMTTMDFSTTTLKAVELTVRNRLDWMAVSTPGLYNKKELGDYMDIDTLTLAQAEYQPLELNAMRDQLFSNGTIRYDQITNENSVMIVWKELMKRPKYRREAERFLASNKGTRKGNGPGPSKQPSYMIHEVMESDNDDDEATFSEPPPPCQDESPPQCDHIERHCQLTVAPSQAGSPKYPEQEVMVCNGVRSSEKSSMHLPVKVAGNKIGALVDTGATNCFVQSKLVESLGLVDRVKPCSSLVVMGNGITEELQGRLPLDVAIEDRIYNLDAFVIKGKGPPLILGYRFLSDHNLVVDCRLKKLYQRDGPALQCNSLTPTKESRGNPDFSKEIDDLKTKVEGLTTQVAQLMDLLSKNLPQSLLTPAQQ